MSDNLLGYYFGYKDKPTNNDNSISVKFTRGISTDYPYEFENKKDFWVDSIYEGDCDIIYHTSEELMEYLDINQKEAERIVWMWVNEGRYKELQNGNYEFYGNEFTFEELVLFHNLSRASIFICYNFDQVVEETFSKTFIKKFENFTELCKKAYENTIKQQLGGKI